MAETQKDRRLQLATPLGEDVLLITSFVGDEGLSQSFTYELELESKNSNIAFNDIIGQNVTIKVEAEVSGSRYFNGFVSEFIQIEGRGQLARYRAKVVPWLWFLTRVSDCRIFQAKTIPQIIEAVFQSRHFSQYELRLTGSYPAIEYCVQYRESDFDFVSRLMEQEGICYFFVHKNGGHTLVLADSPSAHEPCPDCETVSYVPWERGHDLIGIRSWTRTSRVCSGAFAHTDFDFKNPQTNLMADARNPQSHAHSEFEIYDYPGRYVTRGEGQNYATTRIQELQCAHESFEAEADIAGLQVGHQFTLRKAYRDEDNRKYLITRIRHEFHSNPYGTRNEADLRFYQGRVSAIPATVEFRPARRTPRPVVNGPQTAMVVGPRGEEIYTDEYGRVKVQFHWDRLGKRNEKSSCWIRVSQPWAGGGFGGMAIPRIGHEVVVDFHEGNPDRPIIIGRVYNRSNMPHPSDAGRAPNPARSSRDKVKEKKKAEAEKQKITDTTPPAP